MVDDFGGENFEVEVAMPKIGLKYVIKIVNFAGRRVDERTQRRDESCRNKVWRMRVVVVEESNELRGYGGGDRVKG